MTAVPRLSVASGMHTVARPSDRIGMWTIRSGLHMFSSPAIEEETMRTLSFTLLVIALCCTSCAGVVVATGPPTAPVVVNDNHHGRGAVAKLGIPPGHLPPPGECRIWFPGRPPGHQPPPGHCSRLKRELPAGAWLLYRPEQDRQHVIVDVCHDHRAAVVVTIRTYEVASGRFVRERRP